MKKLSVIGAGSAGLLSAVQGYYAFVNMPDWEVELIHDPNVPPEKVGQGTVPGIMNLLSTVFDVDWADNPFEATVKHGIMYKNWGRGKINSFILSVWVTLQHTMMSTSLESLFFHQTNSK